MFSENIEAHVIHLEQVFDVINEAVLKHELSKVQLRASEDQVARVCCLHERDFC